jgi:hypothetical protein
VDGTADNEIAITVRVKDAAAAIAEIKAIEEAAKAARSASGGSAGGITAPVEADTSHLDEDIKSKVENSKPAPINVPIVADGSKIEGDVKALTGSVKPEPITVPIEGDASKLEEDVKAKAARVKPEPISVPLKTDTQKFEEELRASFAEGEKNAENADKAMRQSFTSMQSGIRALRAAMDDLKPAASAADDFETEFRKAMDEGQKVADSASAEIHRSFSVIESGSRTLRSAMAELEPAVDGAGNGLEGAGNRAANAGNNAGNAGNGFAFLHSKVFLLTAGALSLGPALAAIPAVTGAAALGAGTMALAFGGVIGALKDFAAQSANSSASGASTAATAFANSVAIRNAEQAITDAKRQSAQQAQTSAAAIVAAQQAVGDAERQAAQQAQQSADSITAADQHLAQAQQQLTLAQQVLTQAQRDGVNVLKDLNLANQDAANAVADAQNAVTDATTANTAAQGNSLLTAQQKKEALQALIDAQQRLKDSQQKATEAQQTANDANAKGVAGSTAVVSAQQSVQTAMQNVADAQHALVVAQQTAANQQISSSEAVAKAELGLVTAKQQAAQQEQASAEQVSKAVQALSDMETQQALAAQAAGASQNKFAQDMAKLSQPARDLVNQVLGMRGAFHELSTTAQTATLPGFTQMLKDSMGLLPTINGGIRDMGTAIGNTAIGFGSLLKSPIFQGQLQTVLSDAAKLAGQLGTGMLGMVSGITEAAAKAGPIVQGIGVGLQTLMSSGIPDFFAGLVANAGGAGTLFQSLLTLVSNLAGPIGTISGAVASALAPAVQVLASPQVAQSLQSIAVSIAQILTVLTPVITMFAQGLAGALRAVDPMLQATAKFMQDNSTWVVPLARGIAAAAVAWWALNIAMNANPIVLIITGITLLVIELIYAWEHFSGFRDFMKAMWKDIKIGFDLFLAFIKQWWPELLAPFTGGVSLIIGHWDAIVDFVKKLPGRFVAAAKGMWDWVTQTWDTYVAGPISRKFDSFITAVTELPGKLASAGAHLFDWVPAAFKWAINTVIGWWDSLSFGVPTIHIPGTNIDVGGGSIGVPYIHPFASGGAFGAGGLAAVVGDQGAEIMQLPNGTQIMPHANTQAALASNVGSGGAQAIQVEWVGGAAGDEFLTWLRRNIRIRGGNSANSVQRVLGQAS